MPVYGYRYYEPPNGRWTARDPIGEDGGINLIAICQNDLVTNCDALGLDSIAVGSRLLDDALAGTVARRRHFTFLYINAGCPAEIGKKWRLDDFLSMCNKAGIPPKARIKEDFELYNSTNWKAETLDDKAELPGLPSYLKPPVIITSSFGKVNTTRWHTVNLEISFFRTMLAAAKDFVAIYDGTEEKVLQKWQQLKAIARTYPYMEPNEPQSAKDLRNFPASIYDPFGNNSTTFAKWVISRLLKNSERGAFSPLQTRISGRNP